MPGIKIKRLKKEHFANREFIYPNHHVKDIGMFPKYLQYTNILEV